MNAEDSPYKIAILAYDLNICDIGDIDSGNRIKLTATVRDNQNNPPATPQTVYWSCPRDTVLFSRDGTTTTSTSQTDPQTGEATIYVSSLKVALALVSASLNPNGALPFNIQIVFCTIAPNLNSSFASPTGISVISIPTVDQDDSYSFAYNFAVLPQPTANDTAWVAGWTAQIDPRSNIVLEKTLLFPASGQNNPYSWGALQSNGLSVPYQIMDSNDGLRNVVQYLYQEDAASDAIISTWFPFAASGTAWAQPDPYRVVNRNYQPPVIWNPNTEQEEPNPTIINNTYFWWDKKNQMYWLIFHIHTDHLAPGDKIHPYIYCNGFKYSTDQRVSFYADLGEYTVTADKNGINEIIAAMIPENSLITAAYGSDNQYGQIDVAYFANQIDWSPKFSCATQFDPEDLDPPEETSPAAR
ncbi:hypothetical protein [Phyllobacterium salinisoli]|nr:hypothetical protein [Phyllobacterium salinisoli]